MAFAVLSSLAQTVDLILNDDRYPISVDGRRIIESLQKQASFLQKFLDSSPKEASSVETRIRDAANEAEDVIEHFMYEQLRSHNKLMIATAAGISLVNSKTNSKHLYDFHELMKAQKELNSIAEAVMDIEIKVGDSLAVPSSSSTESSLRDDIMVGFDEDLLNIMEMLCGGSKDLEVISIVGMGGTGKTTIARNIYDRQSIDDRFTIRAWVKMSVDYKIENVLSDLLDFMGELQADRSEQSIISLKEKVHKVFYRRRFLIVLDDVWSPQILYDMRNILANRSDGSRLMVTTRQAFDIDFSKAYQLRFMTPHESWNLLRQKVFAHLECPHELEIIGKEIANRCGGLPLAIVVTAGILSTVSTTLSSWEEIAENIHSVFDGEKVRQFDNIISLSYTHLPHHLRSCFLYMGLFPVDYKIHVSKLVKLWIAEGFVKPSESPSFEEGAKAYLSDLVHRSLVLVTSRKTNGEIKTCSLHDVLRDLSRRKARDENFQRRLSIAHSDLNRLAKTYGSTVRSIMCFQPSESSLGALRKFRLLRVLDSMDAHVYSLPAQVFELFHLRYLAFGCPMQIPAAISMLQNLHTLIIYPRKGSRNYSKDEVYLPLEIWNLPMLRHLVSSIDLLPDPEEADFTLENLQTLSLVKKFICTKRILERITNLKKFAISISADKYPQTIQLNNLVYLHRLETLKLIRNGDSLVEPNEKPVFPESLKKLTLSGWHFPWEYMEIVGSLPKLQVLKLRDFACKGNEWETTEKNFCSLEYLLIDRSDLEYWIADSHHFPILKRLVLHRCPSLREIPSGFGEIQTLELIEVDQANKSIVSSAKMIQEEQETFGNWFEVRCVRYHYQGF